MFVVGRSTMIPRTLGPTRVTTLAEIFASEANGGFEGGQNWKVVCLLFSLVQLSSMAARHLAKTRGSIIALSSVSPLGKQSFVPWRAIYKGGS